MFFDNNVFLLPNSLINCSKRLTKNFNLLKTKIKNVEQKNLMRIDFFFVLEQKNKQNQYHK